MYELNLENKFYNFPTFKCRPKKSLQKSKNDNVTVHLALKWRLRRRPKHVNKLSKL